MDSLFGMPLKTTRLCEGGPKLSLPAGCGCSDEVREEFNKWLLEMFGKEPDKAYVFNGTIVTSPAVAHALRKELLDSHPLFSIADRFGGYFHG